MSDDVSVTDMELVPVDPFGEPEVSLELAPQQRNDNLFELAIAFSKSDVIPAPLRGKPHSIMLVLSTGAGLGLSPAASLRSIHNINGRLVVDATAMRGIVLNSGKAKYIRKLNEAVPMLYYNPEKRELFYADNLLKAPEAGADKVALEKARENRKKYDALKRAGLLYPEYVTWVAVRNDDPEYVFTETFTMWDAVRAELFPGKETSGKDGTVTVSTWRKWPANMLDARCSMGLIRRAFPDAGMSNLYDHSEFPD